MNDEYYLSIQAVTPEQLLMEQLSITLLLEADPSEDNVRAYLKNSRCYRAEIRQKTVGVCVLTKKSDDCFELMNIAVAPGMQAQGIGTRLLNFVISEVEASGAHRIELGTGTFGHQLGFYQKAGFRAERVERDFFLKNYDQPVFENGIQHKDMLRLAIEFQSG
ncbi:GNAT family N-acetyltransferase [Endozoicomonas lisbonensis]|uniref:N-acetylglutamate synthase-like GNAT family acetyltransferase n=1 Tax=Endozoicomonas lisbonensis TaxID=3120522 RepID=A0ABV2SLY9_9GAMM